jgi:putative membrane protein
MKTSIFRTFSAIIFLLCAQSCNNANTSIDTSGANFIKTALESGTIGIKASGLVQSRSQNPRVKHLAEMLIAGNTQIGAKLKEFANNGSVKIDSTISAPNNQILNGLTKITGADFDKSYVQMAIKEQEKELMLFVNATQDKNSDLQTFVREALKTIHLQLDSARAVELSLK